MDQKQWIACLIDPDAFSEQTRVWERETMARRGLTIAGNWENRRQRALRKAQQILDFIQEA